jgi:hypothetical protein
MRSIITPWEVVKYNPVDQNLDPVLAGRFIKPVEEEASREWLGKDFYSAMLDDMQVISVVNEYRSNVPYIVDDLVNYRGFTFKCIVANTGKLPADSGFWTQVNKFAIQAYNDLYYNYLREHLSTQILFVGARFFFQQMTNQGLVKRSDSKLGASSGESRDFADWRNDISKMANLIRTNMIEWVNDHYLDAEYLDPNGVSYFDDFGSLNCASPDIPTVARRRFFFR